jgi:hypothetical protein
MKPYDGIENYMKEAFALQELMQNTAGMTKERESVVLRGCS